MRKDFHQLQLFPFASFPKTQTLDVDRVEGAFQKKNNETKGEE